MLVLIEDVHSMKSMFKYEILRLKVNCPDMSGSYTFPVYQTFQHQAIIQSTLACF